MLATIGGLVRRVGKRGTFLLFLFVLDELYALSLANPVAEARQSATVRFIAEVAPLWAWAATWSTVGIVCVVGAFARRDQWAFTFAMGLKVLWGGTFLLGWILAGLDRGWVSGVIWLMFAAFVIHIATWPEPTRKLNPPPRRAP